MSATPPLQLTAVAQALFKRAVVGSAFVTERSADSPASILRELGDAPVWQFWTHGHFDQRDVTRSGLQLAVVPRMVAVVELTVGDLLGAQLGERAPELVVLSACETGFQTLQRTTS